MTQRIARLHLSRDNPVALLRIAMGWSIVMLGIVVAARGVVGSGFTLPREALAGGLMSALATAMGALPLLVMRRIGAGIQSALLGLGAGVMLAASIFSLVLPAGEAARGIGFADREAVLLVAVGMIAGALMLMALDRALPHSHEPGADGSARAVWLFVLAIAVHNIPEGLAIGVASAQAAGGGGVVAGISAQNVPEGLVVALALAGAGYGRGLACAVAALSGLVEPVASVFGASLVGQSVMMLPWGLAGAAGAMLFVVSHEIIPESHRRGHETLATLGLMVGFVAMMMLDSLLA